MNGFKNNNQSISHFIDQLIRYYKIPFSSSKKDALDAVLQKITEQEKTVKKKQKIYRILTSASAAAAVVAVVMLWIFTATISKSAAEGEILTYRLPDESRVVLKENSSLQFKKYNWNRKVKLSGEAYFEVEKGEGFQVITKQGKVEVLGTRFLVQDSKNGFSVSCYEGKVKTFYNNKTWIMEPFTELSGKPENITKKQMEETVKFPEFAKFQRSFKDAELEKVLQEIETFFNVQIEVDVRENKRFTGKIQTGNLANTLEIVSTSLELNYRFLANSKIEIFE